MPNSIRVFEYSRLNIGEKGFQQAHFEQLVRYNERHANRYFTVGNGRIYFNSYVGVVQVGNLTIEILPKADKNQADTEGDKNKWQRALLAMLHVTNNIRVESLTEALLRLRTANLMDIYFQSFVSEVQKLKHEGLVKKYRLESAHVKAWKGRLDFGQQLTQNIVHRERFYTEHTIFDGDNVFNQILKAALTILGPLSKNGFLRTPIQSLLLDFQDIKATQPTLKTFDCLKFDRKTERYSRAIALAKMIILHHTPDVQNGKNGVIALLFDMNHLFESYIFKILKKQESAFSDNQLVFSAQESRGFWASDSQTKTIRPDIIAEFVKAGKKCKIIIDTKWKLPMSNKPDDNDLKQMYAYNLHFNAQRSILLYPNIGQPTIKGKYAESQALNDFMHGCEMHFAELFDAQNRLDTEGVIFRERFVPLLLVEN